MAIQAKLAFWPFRHLAGIRRRMEMNTSQFGTFSEVISDILEKKSQDPVLHLLVLTYEFDEQQLVNLVCSKNLEDDFELRQAQLHLLSDLRPVVIYDARKTKEFSKLPQFLELHPYKTPGFSCHHSKAYLIITHETVQLVLGSFNLTFTGLFRNREVFEHFKWSASESSSIQLLTEWIDFLKENYASRLQESSLSALQSIMDELQKRSDAWKSPPDNTPVHLLYSGYALSKGAAELLTRWNEWFPGQEPDSLLAVSPFFDETPESGCLARDLLGLFPSIKSFKLITDEAVVQNLSKPHFGAIKECELFTIPRNLSSGEFSRIEKAARLEGHSIKDQVIVRDLHAKVLLLQSGSNALVYMGSANFSRKAWQGSNQELGVVWKEDDPEQIRQSLFSCLGVLKENKYDSLPAQSPEKPKTEDSEDYLGDSDFPGFIEQIALEPNDGESQVRFLFSRGNRDSDEIEQKLQDYCVSWAGIRLEITGDYSSWIDRNNFEDRLFRGRNLSFQLKSKPEKIFWFPFQYTGTLVAARATYLHPSSWDWMAFYLNPDRSGPAEPGEFIPGETPENNDNETNEIYAVQRESNCVIAMQGYLNLFSRIERDFLDRAIGLQKCDLLNQPQLLVNQIHDPLKVFFTLLDREAKDTMKKNGSKDIAADAIFKMGELLALLNTIQEVLSVQLASKLQQLQLEIKNKLIEWQGSDQTRCAYIQFMTKEKCNGKSS
jgi:hypothetical protein